MKAQKAQQAIAEKAFNKMLRTDSEPYVRKAYELECQRERDHRKFAGGSFRQYHPHALSVNACARLMVVYAVAQYMQTDRVKWPTPGEMLSMPHARIICLGLADHPHNERIRAAWEKEGLTVKQLATLDYVLAVSPEKFQEAA